MITVETPSRIIPLAYDLGDVVYHRLAEERRKGLITGFTITPDGHFYFVTWPDHSEHRHYGLRAQLGIRARLRGGRMIPIPVPCPPCLPWLTPDG